MLRWWLTGCIGVGDELALTEALSWHPPHKYVAAKFVHMGEDVTSLSLFFVGVSIS